MNEPSVTAALEMRGVFCARPAGSATDSVHDLNAVFGPGLLHVISGGTPAERALVWRLLALQELPDQGDVLFQGRSVAALSPAARAELRASQIAFVYSAPFLLPAFSAVENIAMPLFKQARLEPAEARERAEEALEFVGLPLAGGGPVEALSHCEQRRVALARALAARPAVLLIEEVGASSAGESPTDFPRLLCRALERFGLVIVATASSAFVPPLEPIHDLQLESGSFARSSAPAASPLS